MASKLLDRVSAFLADAGVPASGGVIEGMGIFS
jgi:hypothetical protein